MVACWGVCNVAEVYEGVGIEHMRARDDRMQL
jgi:hypothetical protein